MPVVGSYSGDPGTSSRDWVRFTIQDTGPAFSSEPWYWADTEIDAVILGAANPTQAAGQMMLAWARRLAHNPDFRIGRFSESWNAAAKLMNEKGMELMGMASAKLAGAFVGGISVSDKAARVANTDRTPSTFRRGQFDNPDASW